ncbi:MAG: glycosyltransferase family 9 protein [Bacteroidales bacterium]|nr:glycosyltransferase family 9 protein [Bacteroidales bacterium]
MNPHPERILVIQTASIGDVILVTPVLEKLRYHFPDAILHILVRKGNETLFTGHPFLGSVLVWDKSRRKYQNFNRLISKIRENRYDCVINAQRFFMTGLMTVLSGARMTIGFEKNPLSFFFDRRISHSFSNGNLHEADRNLMLAEALSDTTSFPIRLYPRNSDEAFVSQFKTSRYICIAPGSVWYTKQFPEEMWIRFIMNVDRHWRIYLTGSKGESRLCERIIRESGHGNILNLAGRLSLLQTAALMKHAAMNFVNDSAAMHLASAMDAPVTVVYCSTVPAFGFGPRSTDSAVVETHEELMCRPCGIHGYRKCPEEHFHCAWSIRVEELLQRLPQ